MQLRIINFFIVVFLCSFPALVWSASPYKLTLEKEVALLSVGGALTLSGLMFNKNSSDSEPSDINSLDKNDIPVFDRRFAGIWNEDAQLMSDGFLVLGVVSPISMLLKQRHDALTLGVMAIETYGLSGGAMLLAKGQFTRYRPFVYGDEASMSDKLDSDARRSFFSGHAAVMSSGFVFTATVFSDYYSDSPYKPYVWAGAITALAVGSSLRVVGGKHYPSDVVVGMALGSAVGYLVPRMHRANSNTVVLPFVLENQFGVVASRPF